MTTGTGVKVGQERRGALACREDGSEWQEAGAPGFRLWDLYLAEVSIGNDGRL